MIRICRIRAVGCLLCFGFACALGRTSTAQEEPVEDPIEMIIGLLGDEEPDMRAVGLQYVREEAPGEAATKRFAAVLPNLAPEGQAALVEALGDRADAAARPAVLRMLLSPTGPVRAAALRALGSLGTSSDIPLLARSAAAGSDLEETAARQSLVRLRGDDVNAVIVSSLAVADPKVRVELLGVLAARNAKETLPTVLKYVEDAEPSVRLAALGALRFLADEGLTAELVRILKAAKDQKERTKAELALLVVCSRGRQKCTAAIIEGLADADVPSRIVLLRAVARAGGKEALEEIVGRLKDQDEKVRDQAVRMLSAWPTREAMEPLRAIAAGGANRRHQVLAIRGLVRLAGPQGDQPADLNTLSELMSSAKTLADKRLVLGALGGAATAEALEMALSNMDQSDLIEEAGAAAVRIAEKMKEGQADTVFDAMKKVLDGTKNRQTRGRALRVLGGLATAESLHLVTAAIDEPTLVEDACLAAVMIAERIEGGDKDELRAAMETVLEQAKDKQVRQRAQKVLDSL